MNTLDDGVNKRILQLMWTLHYSTRILRNVWYKSPQTFTRQFRPADPVRPSFPSIQKLCQITYVYANWLITSCGSMFKPSSDATDQEDQAEDDQFAATQAHPYELDENDRHSSILEGDCAYEQENRHQIVVVLCHLAQKIGELRSRLDHLQQAFDQLRNTKKCSSAFLSRKALPLHDLNA